MLAKSGKNFDTVIRASELNLPMVKDAIDKAEVNNVEVINAEVNNVEVTDSEVNGKISPLRKRRRN